MNGVTSLIEKSKDYSNPCLRNRYANPVLITFLALSAVAFFAAAFSIAICKGSSLSSMQFLGNIGLPGASVLEAISIVSCLTTIGLLYIKNRQKISQEPKPVLSYSCTRKSFQKQNSEYYSIPDGEATTYLNHLKLNEFTFYEDQGQLRLVFKLRSDVPYTIHQQSLFESREALKQYQQKMFRNSTFSTYVSFEDLKSRESV